MNEKQLFTDAADVQHILDEAGIPNCIIGGLANLRWGRPRLTGDIDLSVFTGFFEDERVIDVLLSHYGARATNPKRMAQITRVLLLATPAGTGIDVGLAGIPFEEQMINRSSDHDFGVGQPLRTCSLEDFLVLKAFAGRSIDWFDIEGVILRNPGVNWSSVERELIVLLEHSDRLDNLDKLRAERARLLP